VGQRLLYVGALVIFVAHFVPSGSARSGEPCSARVAARFSRHEVASRQALLEHGGKRKYSEKTEARAYVDAPLLAIISDARRRRRRARRRLRSS
jgi:hypothetical protein